MRRRGQHIIGKGWCGLWALMMLLLMVGSAFTARTAHADPANGKMQVVVPNPSGGTVQGPVHANVSVTGTATTAGATFALGWAKQSDGCATGFTPFDGTQPVTADSSGNFTATFVWPDAADTTGALYLICARDTANPDTNVITADQTFQVAGASAPQITLQRAPLPTTTATATPPKGFHANGPVQVNGKGFFPVGTQIAIYVTASTTFTAQDLQSNTPLKTVDGSSIVSDGQGQFTAVVTLPGTTGKWFVHAVSTDSTTQGQTAFPPSLVTTRAIQIDDPLPTPTPILTPTTTPAAGTGTTPGDKTSSGDGMRVVAIAGLGILSLILFIVGGILVASVVLGPRTPPKLDSGTRSQPGAIRSGPQW